MPPFSWPLAAALAVAGGSAAALWLRRNRRYRDSASVAAAYDRWTQDALLERLWGEHIHLGHYGDPPARAGRRDFRRAKEDFVHELVRWSGLERLPRGSKVLDVGCGIGGSARILARDYGFDVLGISISPVQIARARELTPADLASHCRFAVMDAMALEVGDGSFDAVWSVEACPHMPDKQGYADELLRCLRPGGLLAVADWNRRDPRDGAMSARERWVMRQLLEQWAHPEFASIRSLEANFNDSRWAGGLAVETADWTRATLPSWLDSILEGVRRPGAILGLGPAAVLQGLRETPTILLMHWAFATGLMQFGVFRGRKPA
ncbi:methyltransferase domain-containing protein [Cyanobium sp. NIES-981]|uniref:methyltransferase domain-containing protein n=1 Tax=Cyanobium sp. NIES-981 TaxID=1851505 RepID=UPI0007DDA930|nr:methyltransferase domain-containing protein [Cyanobium sp. NIES-981]SBO43607.1 Cyclopropane-fatty-acyl-phospholipid synthase family protein [Cyanobium sp. NIES-981]